MGEAFLQKYPQSSYVAVVNHRLTLDYVATRQEQKAFAAGEKGLAAVNNVVTLAVMCSMMPRLMSLSEQQFISPNDPQRLNLSDPGTPLQLVKSQEYCQRGLRLLDSMKNSVSTSGQSSAPTFDAQRALFHSGLGHLLMRQQQYEPAVRELSAAVDGTGSPAPIDLLMLGVAYENLKKYDESYSAFSRCAKNTSAMQARCAQLRDRVDRLRPPPSLKRKP
jgi:tetratricopeptide (TPR) repeat protein